MDKKDDKKAKKLSDNDLSNYDKFSSFYRQQTKDEQNSRKIVNKMKKELPTLLQTGVVLLSSKDPMSEKVDVHYALNTTKFFGKNLPKPLTDDHVVIFDESRRMYVQLSYFDIIGYVKEVETNTVH